MKQRTFENDFDHLLHSLLLAYHEKLKEAGVKSQIFTVKGVTHGFFHLPGRNLFNFK